MGHSERPSQQDSRYRPVQGLSLRLALRAVLPLRVVQALPVAALQVAQGLPVAALRAAQGLLVAALRAAQGLQPALAER